MSDLVNRLRARALFFREKLGSGIINAEIEFFELSADRIEQLERELAAEKGLADRLWAALTYFAAVRNGDFARSVGEAYRKARGME